ncbi:hypothetical protein bcere0022_8070 [Bacillus cereus Rock3-44]|nr:hypothetical protein bcere0022_8070 [Bacillus cereus Rock3-44]
MKQVYQPFLKHINAKNKNYISIYHIYLEPYEQHHVALSKASSGI